MSKQDHIDPTPLCGHSAEDLFEEGYRRRCRLCGSFWDADFLPGTFSYSNDYPEKRGHNDASIEAAKVTTLKGWLSSLRLDLKGLSVCEVGFGSGATLAYLSKQARSVSGTEAVPANIATAVSQGISPARLFDSNSLPPLLPDLVDIWFFLDSFEHLREVELFAKWIVVNSNKGARLLMVLPQAGSVSERWLGRLWPHKLKDHRFHWSKKGLEEFFSHHGFKLESAFRPRKKVLLRSIFRHLAIKFHRPAFRTAAEFIPAVISFSFNIGEMGLLFRRP